MKKLFPHISASVIIKTELSIERLGEILSDKLFSDVPFSGKELSIYDEVPAVFLKKGFLGLSIILSGYPGYGKKEGYCLGIYPIFGMEDVGYDEIRLDYYLENLLKKTIEDVSTIKVISSQRDV